MGFRIASCMAYITMNGVITPGVSAGSNQVGASEICTPQIICVSGPAAPARPGIAVARPRAASANKSRRVRSSVISPERCLLTLLRTDDAMDAFPAPLGAIIGLG